MTPQFDFGPDDIASPPRLPELGKWMIGRDGTVAHWLGGTYAGKHLREPINIVLVDLGAASREDAKARLMAAAAAAAFPSRDGHSGGYRGYIGGELYEQLPEKRDHAFSNRPFVERNSHGRVFGPAPFEGGYLFIGAFSRERIALLRFPEHGYDTFNGARDLFARNLAENTGYDVVGSVELHNAITDDQQVTTGDHDGHAVLLETR